jgi:HSP20 family protein
MAPELFPRNVNKEDFKMTLVNFTSKKNDVLNPWFKALESQFDDSFISNKMISRVPAVNIAETENDFQIELAAPGLVKENFKISVEKNILTISAENKNENTADDKKFNRIEFSYSTFVRSFVLPETVDYSKIDAEYIQGILKINIAKKEESKIKSREISVK